MIAKFAKFAKFAKSYFVIDVWRPRAALIHRSHRTHRFASKSILSRLACLEEICPTQDTLRSTDVIYDRYISNGLVNPV